MSSLALTPAPSIPATQAVADIGVKILPLRAGLTPFPEHPVTQGGDEATLVLDAIYAQLRVGATVVVENGTTGELHAAEVSGITLELVDISESGAGTIAPMTRVTLEGEGPSWLGSAAPAALTVHFGAVSAGRVVRPANTEIALENIQPSAGLRGPVEPLQLATQSRVLLQDALELGVDLAGNVTDDGAGTGTLMPLGDAASFPALRTPVTVYGNLVSVSRGESVEEILGSGDATQSFQRFRLTKKPLTYLPAPGTATGRAGTLEIWVAGVRWREVESLFLAGPGGRGLHGPADGRRRDRGDLRRSRVRQAAAERGEQRSCEVSPRRGRGESASRRDPPARPARAGHPPRRQSARRLRRG